MKNSDSKTYGNVQEIHAECTVETDLRRWGICESFCKEIVPVKECELSTRERTRKL